MTTLEALKVIADNPGFNHLGLQVNGVTLKTAFHLMEEDMVECRRHPSTGMDGWYITDKGKRALLN
jgi:putative ribosome biogenesis GTPase RsgA